MLKHYLEQGVSKTGVVAALHAPDHQPLFQDNQVGHLQAGISSTLRRRPCPSWQRHTYRGTLPPGTLRE